MLRVGLIVCTQ